MKYSIILLSVLVFATNCIAEISYSVSFDKNELILKEKGDSCIAVSYENLEATGQYGAPSLPYKYLKFYIPDNNSDLSVEIQRIVSDTIALDKGIYSMPKPIPTSVIKEEWNFPKYKTQSIYPYNPVSIIQDGFFEGCYRIIVVRVSPVQYIESGKRILFNSSIDFKIKYATALRSAKSVSKKIKPIYPVVKRDNVLKEEFLKVENIQDLEKSKSEPVLTKVVSATNVNTNSSGINLPVYDYVIITSDNFASSFDRLTSWKRLKGLSVGVVKMQDIYSDANITGDKISGINDNAGKLRQYLTYAFQNGTKYVLLAGQDSIVPVRYGTGFGYSASATVPLRYNVPTDWYYCDLNGNWNGDGDSHYGEPSGDNVDYNPELYVGRILCKNTEEINNYIDKLMIYERNPGGGNYAYLKKAFYSQDDQMQEMHQAQTISSKLSNVFSENTIYEEKPAYDAVATFPYGAEVISKMNERYGLFSWFAHGDEAYGITTKSDYVNGGPYYGITSLDNYTRTLQEESGNGLDNLTNYKFPAIAYTIACTIMPYDKYNFNDVPFSIGESFTVAGKYGGPAFLGNTRVGYVCSSFELYKRFVESLSDADYHLGKAEAVSKANNVSSKHWLALTHNLLGCPELQMWTDIPSNINGLTVSQSGTTLSVGSSVDSCVIAVNGLFDDDSYSEKRTVTGSATFTNLPLNYIVSASKHNYFTYIAPLYLQNEALTNAYYIYAGDVSIGNNVSSERTSGDFRIDSGGSLIINTNKTTTLYGGFFVGLGSSFEVVNK